MSAIFLTVPRGTLFSLSSLATHMAQRVARAPSFKLSSNRGGTGARGGSGGARRRGPPTTWRSGRPLVEGRIVILQHCEFTFFQPEGDPVRVVRIEDRHCERCIAALPGSVKDRIVFEWRRA
jgi:hypothetical protein